MNKSLPWNLREQVCPAIASSPPPAAVPTAPFPSFISPFFNGLASTSTNSYGATVLTSDTTSLRNNEILTDTTNSFGGFLAPSLSASRSYLLGDPSCSALSNPPSITSAHDRQQLTAAAAGYLFAQLTSPGTPYHPPTPTQAPATPQQQINPLDSLFSLSPYNQGDVQRQNTTAALVAALKERCRSTRGSDMFVNNGEGGVDLMGASNNLNNSATSSLVAQLSMAGAGDGSLTANNLASVCAAAAAASTVNASTQPPVATNGEPHVAPSSTSSTAHNTPAPPIILSGPTTNFSALVPPIDAHRRTSVSNVSSCNPSGLQSSSESTSSNFLSPQHSSVFQHLVSPSQGQQTSAVSALSFFPQQSFQTSTEQSPGFQLPASISSSTTSSELIQPPSLGLPSSSSSSTATFSQQAVPACPSRQPQTLEGQHLSPMNQAAAAAAAALYPQLMCFPALLDNLGPHILRNHMNSAQLKPIPNNERVDLASFRKKNPNEWVMDDVLAWMLDVARRNQVPVENINMHKFATCDGPRLLQMTEQNFQERDQVYGSMLFSEFRKLVPDDLPVHDWIRSYKKMEEDPRLANNRGQTLEVGGGAKRPSSSHQMPQHLNGLLGVHSPISPLMQTTLTQHHAAAAAAVAAAAANQQFLSPQGLTQNNIQRHNQQLSAAQLVAACSKNQQQCGSAVNLDMRDDSSLHGVNANSKIKKNKDGRPRKRSQHTKGNKLWEFIRDALKDPSTCPSVVRWEDPIEGVFRIVESEKLARLWGEKKNNHKMTYEKLSRAMRTYYEKNILVPVPKTGLYPKKLVYKFGPGAHGWCAPPHLVAAANAANRMEAMDMS
uniref:ETS domain-containing protein n=1 Tax=Panagrellus redivivus TaxID=6233 RepID=A0A7E4VFH3_PANRE